MKQPRLPTIDDLAQLCADAELTAPPAFEDENGHVNVRHHYGLHMDGAEVAFRGFGIDQAWLARTGQSSFSVEHHVTFHSEILIGDELAVYFRLLDRSAKVIHAMTILADLTTGRVVSTVEFIEAYVDLSTRRTTAMPLELTDRLDEILSRHSALDWDLPRSQALGIRQPGS